MQGTDGLPRESVEPGDVLASAAQENRLADVLEFDALLEPLGSQPAIRGRVSATDAGTLQQHLSDGHCQRKVARTEFSTDDRELGRPELTPLGECGGAVELEIVS